MKTSFVRALLTLPAILALVLVPSAFAEGEIDFLAQAALEAPVFAASQAYCQADCNYGPDVSCSGSSCSAQDDPNGYVTCDGYTKYCAPQPSLSVNLLILSCEQRGAKSIYRLRAYASGGSSYTFSWHNALATHGYTSNPNNGQSTDTSSRTATVTVTSGSASASDSVFLANPCGPILE